MHAYTHFKWLFGHIMQWMLNTRYACFYLRAIYHVHSNDCDMRCPICMQYCISADVAIYSIAILSFIHCNNSEYIHIEMIWTTLLLAVPTMSMLISACTRVLLWYAMRADNHIHVMLCGLHIVLMFIFAGLPYPAFGGIFLQCICNKYSICMLRLVLWLVWN